MSMLNMYPRLQFQDSLVDFNEDDADETVDRDGACVGYGIAVVCVTIFVFCMLVTTVSVWKACAFAALAALLLVAAGCFAPKTWFCRRSHQRGAQELVVITVTAAGGAARPGYPRPQVNAPPAFAFEAAVAPAASGAVVCPVCLEDVRGGEMVRQVPACMHVFHVGCIDMWLHSHRTCPMCRGVISPVVAAVAGKDEAEEAPESSDDGHHHGVPVPPV